MRDVVSSLLLPGMIVNAINKPGEFKILNAQDPIWVDGRTDVIYHVRDQETGHVYMAFGNDLYCPGDLVQVAQEATYEIALSKPDQDEEVYMKIKGEENLLKFLVHTTLEDFVCLGKDTRLKLDIKKEVPSGRSTS